MHDRNVKYNNIHFKYFKNDVMDLTFIIKALNQKNEK